MRTVEGLWVGARLSAMEQLSIKSFLRNGHTAFICIFRVQANWPASAVAEVGGPGEEQRIPGISALIPTKNSAGRLKGCLGSIAEGNPPCCAST